MNPRTRLSMYISAVRGFPGVVDSGTSWISSGTEQSMKDYAVVPLSVREILFNTGIKNRKGLDTSLQQLNVRYSIAEKHFRTGVNGSGEIGCEVVEMEDETVFPEFAAPEFPHPERVSVETLFRLALFRECLDFQSTNHELMKVEEAVFGIKNTVSVADDFMPGYIMGMVEGGFSGKYEEFLRDLQLNDSSPVFILMKETGTEFAGFYSILPFFKINSQDHSFHYLLGKLKVAVDELPKLEFYGDFEFSRALKTLIFQLDFKKNRKLRKSMLNESGISALKRRSIIEEDGDGYRIPDQYSSKDLKEMRSQTDSTVMEGKGKWLKSEITL